MPRVRRKTAPRTSQSLADTAIWLGLVLAVLAVYSQVINFEFTNHDDPQYVWANAHVKAGFTLDNVRWAMTAVVAGNWMPLTLLSHMLDVQLFGLSAGMHHLVNVVLHLLSSILLLVIMRRTTAATWPSAFVAFAFALHPLHVESVAWIAERKDVLSALFFFLALYAYVRYVEKPGAGRYLLVFVAFALGLLAKPMLVTFPFALLLFDLWPMRRHGLRLIWEKIPLIALSAAVSVVTFLVQRSSGAVSATPLLRRMENAITSYVVYVGQTLWPVRLSVFYYYPDEVAWWKPALAALLLLAISSIAVLTWRTRPYLFSGWCWYLGMLVPVIGLVQVGGQAHADRYSYLPMVGLLWIIAWGAADVLRKWPQVKPALLAVAGVAGVACIALAWMQIGYWRNSVTLFQHAVEITGNNDWMTHNLAEAHYSRGNELMERGRTMQALDEFQEAVRVRPDDAEAHNNIGLILANIPGRSSEAISQFEIAARLKPDLAAAQRNLGILLSTVPGRANDALAHLEAAQRLQPDAEASKIITRLRETNRSSNR